MPEDNELTSAGTGPAYAANEKLGKINVAEEIKGSFLDYVDLGDAFVGGVERRAGQRRAAVTGRFGWSGFVGHGERTELQNLQDQIFCFGNPAGSILALELQAGAAKVE